MMVKKLYISIVFLLVATFICIVIKPLSYKCHAQADELDQDSSAKRKTSQNEWVDGGYLNRANVFVSNKEDDFLDALDASSLVQGDASSWEKLRSRSSLVLKQSPRIQFVVPVRLDTCRSNISDNIEIKVEADSIILLLQRKRYLGTCKAPEKLVPHHCTGVMQDLQPGAYEVFLDQTFVGKLRIVAAK